PTKTCMNCHSQIWVGSEMLAPVRESYRTGQSIEWRRVHRLADFVYFDHSIHISKGVGCVSCHGRVDQMPLTWQVHSLHMDWCLDCHRQPEHHLRPRDKIFELGWQPEDQAALGSELREKYSVKSKTSCSTCHR
ncbi:MAG: cytochrome c3 family protein, partial [Gemmataceae bacterium]